MDIKEFELMRDKAELNALSIASQYRPLTDRELERMKFLAKEVYGIE